MAPALSLCAQEAPDEDKQWASSPHLLRPAFTLLHDTPLTHQVVGGSWCPCMDLLALVTEDGQLSIQRLDAQRLWSTQLDLHTLTSLCWQPEGKVLAAAGSDGRVTLYDVERCSVLSHWLPGPKGRPGGAAPVVSLSWVQALPLQPKSAQQQMFAMRHHRLLSWPGMALASATSQQGLDRRGSPAPGDWPPAPEALNCLVASTSRGEVAVAAFGSFQFLYLPTAAAHGPSTLPAPAEPAGSEGGAGSKARGLTWQSSAHLSRDLAFLITTACLAPDCLPDDLAAGALTCRVHWLGGLHQRHADLHLLAVLAGELQHTLEVASAAVAKAGRQWQSAQAELVKQLGVLASCLLDHQEGLQGLQGPEGEQVSEEEAVAAELACTLASGVASPGLAAFLSGRLTEAGLRRLAKMLDSSLQAVHALLQEQVQPALHCACFLLGELRGLAAPQGGAAQELGLQAELCGAAEAEAARALLGAEALRLSCGRLGAQYRALCSWLLRTVLVLDDEVVPEVAASLPGGLSAAGSAAASMRVDEAAVVALLEAGLHTDCLTPDLTEGWVDPDLAPASLTWRQALPLEDLRPLLHLLHTPGPPSAWTAPRQLQRESSPGPPKHRVEQAGQVRGSPVQPSATCPDPAMALDPGRPPAGGSSGPAAGDWPCWPLRKQLAALQAEVELLLQGLPGRLSPGVTPLASLTILPPLPAAALQGCHSLEELHGTDSGKHGWGCSTPLAVVLPQLKAEGLPPCPDPSAAASCSVTLAVHVSAGLLRHCRQQHVSGSMSPSPPQPSPPQHTAGRAQEGVLLLELQCKAGTSGQQADQLREGQDTCFGTVTGVQVRSAPAISF
ncbi:anaphase-promoting complex, cyclosome, subunit 4-domain-containing protein [Haematococcus lacustris]